MLPRGSMRRRGDAVDDEMLLDHMRGSGEGRIGRGFVAVHLDEADIVGAIVPDQRRAGSTAPRGRDHRRQRLVVDLDQFGGVDRLM